MKNGKIKLSLCMIAKNEASCIKRALDSVHGFADEMIVLDTGSTDATVQIARDCGATVFESKWNDDFALARNESLNKARGEWILVLDADECLSENDRESLGELMASTQYEMISLVQTTYTNETATFGWIPNTLKDSLSAGFSGFIESPLVRLFKNKPYLRFVGRIHENVMAIDGSPRQMLMSSIRIHHYGKLKEPTHSKNKDQLYLELGLKKCREHPNDYQAWYELGVQYWGMNKIKKAKSALLESNKINPDYVRCLIALAVTSVNLGERELAVKYYTRVLELEPGNVIPYLYLPNILTELGKFSLARMILDSAGPNLKLYPVYHINKGVILQNEGNFRAAIDCFNEALALNQNEVLAKLNLAISLGSLGQKELAITYFKACVDDPHHGLLASKKLFLTLLEFKRVDEALKVLNKCENEDTRHDDEFHYYMGLGHFMNNDTMAARKSFLQIRALQKFPPEWGQFVNNFLNSKDAKVESSNGIPVSR